jgi:hypothetical protein
MKYILSKSLVILPAFCLLFAGNVGCKKTSDFGDLNTRTDAAIVPVTAYLLTNALANVGGTMSSNLGGIRAGRYAQQFAETQYTDVSVYGTPQLDFGGIYAGSLEDLQKIIDLNSNPATSGSLAVSTSGSNGNQLGVARIMRAYTYWLITDRWGDVPYSQALKGADILTPKYDKQEDIYKNLLAELKGAIASFDAGAPVKGDIFYAGNAAKWKKLANSLRMLISLRMSKQYPNAGQLAATEFAAAVADPNGAIITNADNLTQTYDGATTLTTNPWYGALVGRKDDAFSLTFDNILTNLADGRKAAFATPGPAFPYGLPRNLAVTQDNATAGNSARLFASKTQTTPIVIVPAAYVLFAQAEAVQRGWVSVSGQTAKSLYEDGITASFAQWGISGAAAYISGAANFNSGAGGGASIGVNTYGSIVGANALTPSPLERIQLQRYIASYGDGIQAWAEWRRTGVPNLTPTTFGTNSPKEIPRRFTYGVGEYATNSASVNEAAARYTGGDAMNSRMWWDKQ